VNSYGDHAAIWKPAEQAIGDVRNIFCVGRNYSDHALELGNEVPEHPLIFGKSTHALAAAKDTVILPAGKTNIHHEIELVLYIGRTYEAGISANDLVKAVALGLDLTDRDIQTKLKKAGHPWELAKGFPGSAVVTDFYEIDNLEYLQDSTFTLELNGKVVQTGLPSRMIFDFQSLVDYVGKHFTLQADDILYTGTPEGVGPLSEGQVARMHMNGHEWGKFQVQIENRG
jgi:fumarylpyruvate hydrolase